MAYIQPYQPAGPQPVAQPVMVAYQGPPSAVAGPICTICRQACVGSYFKCASCAKNHKDYFLCGVDHARLPVKKTGGLFNIHGIVNGISRDIGTVAHVFDGNAAHENWHEFTRVDPPVHVQPAQPSMVAPPQGYANPQASPQAGAYPPLPQAHGYGNPNAPPAGYVANPGYGNPNAPPAGFNNPNYAMGSQYAPPQGGYATMQQGQASPMGNPPGYAPSAPPAETGAQGYSAQGYASPQQGYAPPGYTSPQGPQPGYAGPPQGGYAPLQGPQPGYAGPPQGYGGAAAALPVYVPPGAYNPAPLAQTVTAAAQPTNRTQLTLSLRQLPVAQITGERPSPSIVVMAGNKELGRTESFYGTTDPNFKTPVIFSNSEEKLTFVVYDAGDKRIGTIKDVSLKDIMSSAEWSGRLNDVKTGYRLATGTLVVNGLAVVWATA